ncbi:MAG: heavy-metal-associated domain-containing protein [Spirochaetes bacterium]|nr:heavy-metal-associated domain-containing protein [Spirochaetota bacterium]
MTFRVLNISCAHCKAKIENELRQIEGITEVNVNIVNKTVEVRGNFSFRKIKDVLETMGYQLAEGDTLPPNNITGGLQ